MALRVKKVETGYTDGKGVFHKGVGTGVKKTTRKNPWGPPLGDAAFNAGKQWARHGAHESGVANARVRHYGFIKWYNDQRPATLKERGNTKARLEKAFNEWYSAGKWLEAGGAKKKANPNPLPIGKYIKAKVKRMANGEVKVLITR